MAGGKTPGPHSEADAPIDDGTMMRGRSPTPGPVGGTTPDSQSKDHAAVFVFFFGGYRSTQANMNSWVDSAKRQRFGVTFRAFPYPEKVSSNPPASVVDQFEAAIEEIENTTAGKIFVVGHSSGCAIANGVQRRLKDMKNIALVALDGFLPDAEQLGTPGTQTWGAVSGKAKSLHHDGLQSGGGKTFDEFHAHANCTTKIALHFSLVNTKANDKDLKTFDDILNGYNGCVANLCWLK